jgi:hypothetical protein
MNRKPSHIKDHSDISIEYAHIYTNQHINDEQRLSLAVLGDSAKGLEGHSVSRVVMVDDYSFPDPSFDYDGFVEWLAAQGHKPDLVFRESQLIPVCDEVLKLMGSSKLANQITEYVKAKKYPCSLFISAWYLLRLGRVQSPLFPQQLRAKKLITILAESFKPVEDKALDIISATKHSDCLSLIECKYYKVV